MKLREIRDKYLSLKMMTNEARIHLRHAGVTPAAADELLSLWVGDEWERSVKHVPECIRARAGRE